jgi:hypothetical protein
MMAASLKDADALVDLLLSKGADVNMKSMHRSLDTLIDDIFLIALLP